MTISGTGNYYSGPQSHLAASYNGPPSPYTTGTLTIDGLGGGLIDSVVAFNAGVGTGLTGTINLVGGPDPVEITVENLNGELYFQAPIRVGIEGNGYLNISGGAKLFSRNTGYVDPATQTLKGGYYSVNVGRNNGTGVITVDGTGSFLGAYGDSARMNIGRDGGTGTLNITNGATAGATTTAQSDTNELGSPSIAAIAAQTPSDFEQIDLSNVSLALIGGHETTYRTVSEELRQYGLKHCVHVPPHSIASNSRHQIKDKISNCDLIITITSYVDHSVSKCVKQLKDAKMLAGECIRVSCHGKSGLVREVLEHFANPLKPSELL